VVSWPQFALLLSSMPASPLPCPAPTFHAPQETGGHACWAGCGAASASRPPFSHLAFSDFLPLQVAIYAGFVAELYAWFCVGEIVGRGGSLTGYSV